MRVSLARPRLGNTSGNTWAIPHTSDPFVHLRALRAGSSHISPYPFPTRSSHIVHALLHTVVRSSEAQTPRRMLRKCQLLLLLRLLYNYYISVVLQL